MNYFCQLILLFSLFLLLFINPVTFFYTIYECYCTISINFYFYLPYFQPKNFSFSKIKQIPNGHDVRVSVEFDFGYAYNNLCTIEQQI